MSASWFPDSVLRRGVKIGQNLLVVSYSERLGDAGT